MAEKTPEKEKKSSSSNRLWTVRAGDALKGGRGSFQELIRGLKSKDLQTRRMAGLFFLSCLGLLLVVSLVAQRLSRSRVHKEELSRAQMESQKLGELLKKQADDARAKYSVTNLGHFVVELKRAEGERKVPGVMNRLELELIAECDDRETATYIEEHLAQARSQIVNLLIGLEREEVFSLEGKQRLKKDVLEKLNLWLPHGKVQKLFFNRLIVS